MLHEFIGSSKGLVDDAQELRRSKWTRKEKLWQGEAHYWICVRTNWRGCLLEVLQADYNGSRVSGLKEGWV